MTNQQPPWSTVVPHTSRSDRGDIRRAVDPSIHPELGYYGCRTLYEGFRRGVQVNPLGPCMGFRAVSTSGFATPFIYTSYTECLARINSFAAGLDSLNLIQRNDTGMLVIGLYMKNCMEWVMAEHAAFTVGAATVPFYDTLGPDTVQFILGQTGAKSVVCSRAELTKLCETARSGACPTFTTVILVDGVTPEANTEAKAAGLEVISYARVEAVGAQRITATGHKHNPPTGKDVATFCYTSGTTGNPKGALITHENVMSTLAGMRTAAMDLEVQIYDRHLSYLPLAHIFERVIMSQMFVAGASVGFFRGSPLLLIEDIQACRPTILPVVPRVLNSIHDKIQTGISAAGGFKKKLFDAGVAAKMEGLRHGHSKHTLYDKLMFNKIKKGLGMDCLRLMISGSAPLSPQVMMFYRCMLGVPVVEGYGQTEGTAAATVSNPDDVSSAGHVGGPTGVVEIALFDVPEMGYLHTDTNHRGQPCHGRGEICIRGPNVFKGYYKDEEKTRETIDAEGWLHSGDVGLFRPDGALQIIDRKKNIFKLAQGEYVAPEKIENILLRSPLIAQVFAYGDSLQSSMVAIVVPDEEAVHQWAAGIPNLANLDFGELCKSSSLKDAVLQDIKSLSKESKLHGYETIKAVHLDKTLFSVENDLLTPTFKLKRNKIQDHYEREIAELYSSLPPPKSKL